ncbi:PKD domain-containing protein [Natribaculum luteum]|uniref:PKD domain-containing protein n=1 Tax=Natribaculum luteum TaxID=1586232 RepID=A0ABD5P3P1_9EURY
MVLGDELDQTLTNATIGIPVEQEQLPETVRADDDQVRLQWYNESGNRWEQRNLTVRQFDAEDGTLIDGEYWVTTVDEFSTYGVTVADDSPPELVDATPTDGTTLDHDTEAVTVELEYADNISAINTSALELHIDGKTVTNDERTEITSRTTVYENLSVGSNESYTVELDVADEAGNEQRIETKFEVAAEQGDDSGDGNNGGGGGSLPALPRDSDDGGNEIPTPTAVISIDPDPATVGEEITFSAANSTDNEREIISYEWEIDGESFTGKTVTTSFDEAGTYDVDLTVTNDFAEPDTATDTVTVEKTEDSTGDGADRTDDGSDRTGDDSDETSDDSASSDTTSDNTSGDDLDDSGAPLPGFGISIALIAILSFAMLSHRRQN